MSGYFIQFLMAFFVVLSAMLGAAIGSFSLVIVQRTMRGQSWWGRSRSHCPSCRVTIPSTHLIPVLSFLILQGKCHHCHARIPLDHIAVEIIIGVIYVLSTVVLFTPDRIHLLFIWWVLLIPVCINTLSDLYQMKVLDIMSITMIVLCSLYTLLAGSMTFSSYLWGIIVGSFVFAIQFLISRGKSIGSGDIYLGIAMGALLGWPLVLISIFFAYILGTIYVLPPLITGRVTLLSRIPLAPFLMGSMLICFFWGPTILHILRLT